MAALTGVTDVYGDYAKMMEDKEIDAVVVATPTFMKMQVVKAAVQAGKHIFCEKPMALTLADADELIRVSKQGGKKFQVGYQRRFDPSYMRVKSAIDVGEIGTMLLLRSNTPATRPRRSRAGRTRRLAGASSSTQAATTTT